MSAATLLALCLFAFGSIGLVSAAAALKLGEPTKKTADAYGVPTRSP